MCKNRMRPLVYAVDIKAILKCTDVEFSRNFFQNEMRKGSHYADQYVCTLQRVCMCMCVCILLFLFCYAFLELKRSSIYITSINFML